MDIMKIFSLFVMMAAGISVSQAATSTVRNDSLSVHGFDFAAENDLKAKDVYGACYRLEEPLIVDLSAEGFGVAFQKSWVSKVRFTLAQSKVISPTSLRAKDTDRGVTWLDERVSTSIGSYSRLYELGNRRQWTTYSGGSGGMVTQNGWEVETNSVSDSIEKKRVYIPTRNLQTIEFIFESQANSNDIHIMFERQPGTNYMKNTGVWWPEAGHTNIFLETDTGNILGHGNMMNIPYTGFNLVRTERISFGGWQHNYDPSNIRMGVYETGFIVEPDTEKYGFTAAQYDAACK